ncbi:hypothetical protein [Bdellovibrio sp. HCB209]|uniref:hypothetical protein n=1 Tax=Bdellovibrio sp. HCB209 TaxID=3394354 RepID=UPI0039B42411
MANQNMNQKPQQGQTGEQQQPNKNWNQERTGDRSTVQPGTKQPQKDIDSSVEE